MQYRRLGRSGLKLSALGLGSYRTFGLSVNVHGARELLSAARDAGVNFFDNAESYAWGESEIVMGEALRSLAWPRDSYCVSSKVFFGHRADASPVQRGLSRKHIVEACHQSLRRLQVDYLDLYFCHRPDLETPVAETVSAMDLLIRQGKVLYWGTSMWPANRIAEAYRFARKEHMATPSAEQPEYNLLSPRRVEVDYRKLIADLGIGLTTWSPLYSGLLSGRYNDGSPDDARSYPAAYGWLRSELQTTEGQQRLAAARELQVLAAELAVPLPALCIAWCLMNPTVTTVLLGASRLPQLQDNLKALEVLPRLDADASDRIRRLLAPLNRGKLARQLSSLADPDGRRAAVTSIRARLSRGWRSFRPGRAGD